MNAPPGPLEGAPVEIPPIISLADAEKAWAADFPAFVSKFRALMLGHLDDPGPEFEYIVDGWFSVGDRSIIGGASKAGKSFLATHLGLCIAHGMDFFGAAVKPGLVVYQAGEGARGVKKRLRAWRKHHGVELTDKTPFVLLQSPIDIYHADGDTTPLIEEINAIAKLFDVPLRMIVVDTLATAMGGADEISGKDMGAVLKNVARISAATRAHVCLVHHMNAGGERLRGHSSVPANMDQTVLVKRNETTGVRTVRLDKNKDDEDGLGFQFELMSIELAVADNGRKITSCVCLPVGEKEAIRKGEEAKGLRLTEQEIIFMRALFDADKRHGRPVPPEVEGIPAKVRSVVTYDDIKRAYVALNPSDALPDEDVDAPTDPVVAATRRREKFKKQLQRLREGLTSRGVIGAANVKGDSIMWWSGKPLRAFPWTLPREERDYAPLPGEVVDDLSSVNF